MSQLVGPEACKSFGDAIKILRKWQQGLQRAAEIHATLPDASLLLRGVDNATSGLLTAHPMIGFRVNAFRHQLAIDYNPTVTAVMQLVKLIQAECEAASITSEGVGDKRARTAALSAGRESAVAKSVPTPPPPPNASVAAVSPASGEGKGKATGKGKAGDSGAKLCHKFADGTGCRYGDACNFKHDRMRARKENKCLACGQAGHFRPECSLVAPENRLVSTDTSGHESNPKASSPNKGDPKGKAKAKAAASKGVVDDAKGEGVAAGSHSTGTAGVNQEQLLAEAAKLLKGVTLKPVRVEGDGVMPDVGIDGSWLVSAITSASDTRYALVDSGATNALRPACEEELQKGRKIKVDLASGEATLSMNKWGTLLHDGVCQVILPAGYLVDLGYAITWKRKECKIRHPRKGVLKVSVVKGCPLIPREVGLQLLGEYEAWKERGVAGVKVLEVGEDSVVPSRKDVRAWLQNRLSACGDQGLTAKDQLVYLRAMFPSVPEELLRRVVVSPLESSGVDWADLPWNRRFRRSVRKEPKGSVLICIAERPVSWKGCGRVVSVSGSGAGVGSEIIFRQLVKWAEAGVVGGVIYGGGVSNEGSARPETTEDGLDLGGRCGSWGLSEKGGTVLVGWLRSVLLFAIAQAARELSYGFLKGEVDQDFEGSEIPQEPPDDVKDPRSLALWAIQTAAARLSKKEESCSRKQAAEVPPVFFLLENPPDSGVQVHTGSYPWPWTASSLAGLVEVYHLNVTEWSIVGKKHHGVDKLVWVTTSWFMFEQLQGLEVSGVGDVRTGGCAAWPVGLLRTVQKYWLDWKGEGRRLSEVAERKLLLSKLTEHEAQLLHERNDHVPYRRGCEICISSQGRQRAHWRKSFTNIYSANFDLAGPFVPGRSFDPVASGRDKGLGYRYLLVCAYTIPDLARVGEGQDSSSKEGLPIAVNPLELELTDAEVMRDLDELQCSFDPLEVDTGSFSVKVVDRRVRGKRTGVWVVVVGV